MVTGLREIADGNVYRQGGKELEPGIYLFDGEGHMLTGKQTVNDEGDEYTYYFKKNGQAYTKRLVKGSIYGADGVRLEAEDGSKYEVIELTENILDESGKTVIDVEKFLADPENAGKPAAVIVNSNGTVKKNASTVDVDGTKYTVKGYFATEKGED